MHLVTRAVKLHSAECMVHYIAHSGFWIVHSWCIAQSVCTVHRPQHCKVFHIVQCIIMYKTLELRNTAMALHWRVTHWAKYLGNTLTM